MGVPVKHGAYSKPIDWLFQSAGPEKSKNFRIFPVQRRADGRVMEHSDTAFGLQFGERLFQANGVTDGFLNELFNERLTPRVQHSPAEAAAETGDTGKADSAYSSKLRRKIRLAAFGSSFWSRLARIAQPFGVVRAHLSERARKNPRRGDG